MISCVLAILQDFLLFQLGLLDQRLVQVKIPSDDSPHIEVVAVIDNDGACLLLLLAVPRQADHVDRYGALLCVRGHAHGWLRCFHKGVHEVVGEHFELPVALVPLVVLDGDAVRQVEGSKAHRAVVNEDEVLDASAVEEDPQVLHVVVAIRVVAEGHLDALLPRHDVVEQLPLDRAGGALLLLLSQVLYSINDRFCIGAMRCSKYDEFAVPMQYLEHVKEIRSERKVHLIVFNLEFSVKLFSRQFREIIYRFDQSFVQIEDNSESLL